MRSNLPSTLSIAVASGKMGFVYHSGGELRDWGLSSIATKSPETSVAKAQAWIDFYSPALIVTEHLSLHTRKSGRTIENIEAISKAVQKTDIHHIEQEHVQYHANKYEEIREQVERYPDLYPWQVTPRKLWESERKNTVIFEALALLDQLDS